MTYSKLDTTDVSNVIMYLDNYRHVIIEELFGEAPQGYRDEWHARSLAAFWGHLDKSNQRRVTEMINRFSS